MAAKMVTKAKKYTIYNKIAATGYYIKIRQKSKTHDRDTNKGILERGRMSLQDLYVFRRHELTVAPAHIIF